jgi:HEAT repeat protein
MLGLAAVVASLREPPPPANDPMAEYREAQRHMKYPALLKIGDSGDMRAVEPLLGMLEAKADELVFIVYALGALKDPRAVDPLLDLLRQSTGNATQAQAQSYLIEQIAVALGNIGDPRATEPLLRAFALQPKDAVDRYTKASFRAGFLPAFGKLRAMEVYDRVLAALYDDRCEIRASAAEALGLYGDPRAVEPLIAALRDTAAPWPARLLMHVGSDPVPFAPTVRECAARALGEIGDQRAVPSLIAALDMGAPDDRRAAAEALKSLTNQDFGEDVKKWQEWWEAQGEK